MSLLTVSQAQSQFSNSSAITIADNSTATPYPSTLNVADGSGQITGGWQLNNTSANQPPTILPIPDQITHENESLMIPFTISDAETPADSLVVAAISSNQLLVPNSSLVLGGSGAIRTLKMTPAENQIGTATITLTVSDGESLTIFSFTLTVLPALLEAFVNNPGADYVLPINSVLSFSGAFSPSGIPPYSASWTISGPDPKPTVVLGDIALDDTITCPEIVFPVAGFYGVALTVTDGANTSATATMSHDVVIYDPNGGFVTGGGWINSPPGACVPNPNLAGKAAFGFNAKYAKGAQVPGGETEFQLANLNFHSTGYEWLVVSGAKAEFEGSGTINGVGGYGFRLTATVGQTRNTSDTFRMVIWDKGSGVTIYDNVPDAAGGANAADGQALGGGSIVIHR